MIIDLSEWKEYQGKEHGYPPTQVPLEFMQILMADVVVEIPEEFCPPCWKPDKGTLIARTYWRIKK